jgi:DNA invertase Pin-like site-specific DNA recombinase
MEEANTNARMRTMKQSEGIKKKKRRGKKSWVKPLFPTGTECSLSSKYIRRKTLIEPRNRVQMCQGKYLKFV